MEAVAYSFGIQRIFVFVDLLATYHQLESFGDSKQLVFKLGPRPLDHVFDGNVIFDVFEFHQGQFILVIVILFDGFLFADEVLEALLHFIIEVGFQTVALQSDFAHGFEVHVAFPVVVDFVREFKHRVVDVFHQNAYQVVESVQGKTPDRVINRIFYTGGVNDFEFGCQHLLPVFLVHLP